jgi:carbon-monoxide dehydrogenase small subunit
MLIAAALAERPDLDDAELVELVSSNLCRCTGYHAILAAARAAAGRPDPGATG